MASSLANIRLLLLLSWGLPIALNAQAKVATIDDRPECEPRLYHDPPVSLSDVADTSSLFAVLTSFRRDLEPIAIDLEYGPTGALVDVRVASARRSQAELRSIAGTITPSLRTPVSVSEALRLSIVVDSGYPRAVALRPADYTCLPTLRNRSAITSDFLRRVADLRRRGVLAPTTTGEVLLVFTVTPDGRTAGPRIERSSGSVAADSVALAALATARFLPAVAGRHAVPMPTALPLRF